MAHVKIYMTRTCGYCRMALSLLEKRGAEPERMLVDVQPELRQEMMKLTGRTSVPQVFISEKSVGGYDDLVDLDMDGELEEMLSVNSDAV